MEISKYKVYPVLISFKDYIGIGGAKHSTCERIRIGEGSYDRKLINDRIQAWNKTQYEYIERPFTIEVYGEQRTGTEVERIVWCYETGHTLIKFIE